MSAELPLPSWEQIHEHTLHTDREHSHPAAIVTGTLAHAQNEARALSKATGCRVDIRSRGELVASLNVSTAETPDPLFPND